MDFLTVVNVFRVLLTVELFFLDSYDLLASQVADLDFFTIVDIFGMFAAVELSLFDGDDFLAGKITDLDIFRFPGCITPDWVTAIFDNGCDKLAVFIKPDESVKLIVDKAILSRKLVERMSANRLAAV